MSDIHNKKVSKQTSASSQLCHCCGARKEDLTLADRMFVCPDPDCGYSGDRDQNAASGSGYDQTENGLGTWSKTKKAHALRHPGVNQEQPIEHFESHSSMRKVAETRLCPHNAEKSLSKH